MKYATKVPPTDNELSCELLLNGWTKIKEPKSLTLAIICSVPFMILNSVLFLLLLKMIGNTTVSDFFISLSQANEFVIKLDLSLILLALIFLSIHEILHAIFIPNFIKSDKTFIGITLYGGFVATFEKIRKERYLLISFAPFILLSIILPIVLNSMGLLNGTMIILCLLNAMGSGVDFLNVLIISFQVPKGAYIINNGVETYFK